MPELVADAVIDRLAAWDVRHVFGFSGDGIDPLLAALHRDAERVTLITARHEESAAFMATAYAKWTGRTGCCLATHGPGAIHLLNGLYDAKLDKKPVVAVIAQQHQTALGSGYQQEIDAVALFKDVCGAYLATITTPEQVHLVVDRAVRTAQASRAPTCVIIPHDVQQMTMPAAPTQAHARIETSPKWAAPRVLPDDGALSAAAELLDAGERPAILVGQGALGARQEVRAVAEHLGAGVAKALLGKAVLPDTLPYVTGAVGHLGTTASETLMTECDTLLIIGSNEPYTEFLPKPGQARAVQIDIDGRNLGSRYPTEVNLAGDAAETIRELLPLLASTDRQPWVERVEGAVRDWWSIAARRAQRAASPLNPQLLFHELSPRLPDDALLAVDVGSATYWYARHLKIRGDIHGHLSSTLASMGCALPYAVAAKTAHPSRPVVALVGDGSMQMNGINELITVARHWRDWADPRLAILVLDNGDLNEVTWEQREMEGDPMFARSQVVDSVPYGSWAELLGLRSTLVDQPDDVGAAWDEALHADRPMLIHAVVDPAVPLLPPRLEPAMREKMERALDAEATPTARRALVLLHEELADQEH